jgi:hypothetical protein
MINVPISVGELFDKITILEIKLTNVKNKTKLKNIKKEYNLLLEISKKTDMTHINYLILELKQINSVLWDVENKIRNKEHAQEFNLDFIELARSIYKTNDIRAAIKKKINEITNSIIHEEKEHL